MEIKPTQNDSGASNPNSDGSEQSDNHTRPSVVAGKTPKVGVSLSSAYYTALSAVRHNSMKSNIDTTGIGTSRMAEKTAEARAAQAVMRGSYTPSHIVKSIGLEAKASFYESLARYRGGISLTQYAKTALSTGASASLGGVQSSLSGHDDMGSQVSSAAVSATVAAHSAFKMAQTASPLVINGVVSVGKGAWDVTTTLGRASVALVRTAGVMSSGFIPFNARFAKTVLLNQAHSTGLLNTSTSKRIISGVQQIQANIAHVKRSAVRIAKGVQTGVSAVATSAIHTVTTVRGIARGTIRVSAVAHSAALKTGSFVKTGTLKSIKIVGTGTARGLVKGGAWALKSGLPSIGKGIDGVAVGVGGALSNSDDMMLSGVGKTIQLTSRSVKTGVAVGRITGRGVKTTVKGIRRAAKGTYSAIAFVKQKGLRAAWAKVRNKAATAIANAGKSTITAIFKLIKGLGSKVVLPIILIACFFAVILGIFSAPTMAVGNIFSGLFDLFDTNHGDDSYKETDIREFILDTSFGIPSMRSAYISNLDEHIRAQHKSSGGEYDYVRFKTNVTEDLIDSSTEGIEDVFYKEVELANIIQPIFNSVLLCEYELAPTEEEAKAVLSEIFNKLFGIDEEATLEWCGQSLRDGAGATLPFHGCGSIHAASDCPNLITGTHESYTCSICCYRYCPGHTTTDSDGNKSTTFCSGCMEGCSGYHYCGGHNILTVILNMDGIYQLQYEYFKKPIEELSSISRTEEEDNRLSTLKDTYEICNEMIGQVSRAYGGGMTMEDLSGIAWVYNSRIGNQALIDIALSQVGQAGGQPYWSWYGLGARVEWCAIFVSWCMYQEGIEEVRFSSCTGQGMPYFKEKGRWADPGFTDVTAGDVIFYDWDGSGDADHVGLVIGTDGEYVYTVEGNNGDACRIDDHLLDSNVIRGYGLIDDSLS